MVENQNFPNIKISLLLSIAVTGLVVLGIAEMPYGFYTFLRLVFCISAVYLLIASLDAENPLISWGFGIIAALYNPILPIHLGDKTIWVVLNVLTVAAFWTLFIYIYLSSPSDEKLNKNPKQSGWSKADLEVAKIKMEDMFKISSSQPREILHGLEVKAHCMKCNKLFPHITGELLMFEHSKGSIGFLCESCIEETNSWREYLGLEKLPYKTDK